jgi:hypothetical protein
MVPRRANAFASFLEKKKKTPLRGVLGTIFTSYVKVVFPWIQASRQNYWPRGILLLPEKEAKSVVPLRGRP